MKKIIALMLAILMMAAMAVPAFAEQVVAGSDATAESLQLSGGTVITYGTSQQYTVTIPVAIDLNSGAGQGNVTISDYSLAADKELTISINSSMVENYTVKNDNKWYLFENGTNTGATDVEYFVKVEGAGAEGADLDIARGGDIMSANTANGNADVAVTLLFSTEGTSQVASFTDTVSFLATIGDLD